MKRGINMNRFKILLCIICASLTVTFSGCLPKEEAVVAPPLITPSDVEMKTVAVTKGSILQELSLNGFVVPKNSEIASFKDGTGVITKLHVKVGDTVTKGQAIAEMNTDDVKISLKQAKLAYDQINNSYKELLNNAESSKNDIDRVKLDLDLQKLKIDKLESDLANLTLVAPISGQITYQYPNILPGQMISSGMPIYMVSDVSSLVVEGSIEKNDSLKVGMDVIGKDGEKGKISQLDITPFQSMLQSGTNNKSYNSIRIEMNSLPPEKLGSSITLSIRLDSKDDILKIPKSAIKYYNSAPYVRVLKDGDRTEKFITLGIEGSQEFEVVSGLSEGEEVLCN